MTGFGVYGLLAGALELTVPSYALRLVRRFGTQQVGWFVVLAFSALGLLHLVSPLKLVANASASGSLLPLVYAAVAALLVIGMGHVETMCADRREGQAAEQKLRATWAREVNEQLAELARGNQQLVEEISRRDQIEKALRQSEAQYRQLFADSPQPMWVMDLRSSRFLAVNRAALHQFGFTHEEFLKLAPEDLMSSQTAAAFLQGLAEPCAGAGSRGPWQLSRKDSTLLEVEVTAMDLEFGGSPARLVVAQDVTGRRRCELESQRALKMDAIAQVASGVAQHFSNLLGAIQRHAELLLTEGQAPDATARLEQISAGVRRAAGLTRQLLAAGGQQNLNLQAFGLNRLLQNLGQALRRLLGDQIKLQNLYDANLPPVLADPHMVEQVVIDLALNARDAMPAGGTLTLGTARVRLNEGVAALRLQAKAGEFVRLTVRDTGCGMTPEVQARLFEPFFTTHEAGQAIGLGLASVHGIVKQHNGWIEIATGPGTGTEFNLYFPSAPPAADSALAAVPAAASLRHETILLVEPEDRARGLARFILNRHGYRVIEADDAPTALLLWESEATKVDLLLTELTLPGTLSGPDLARQLRQNRPGLKVLYSAAPDAHPQAASPSEPAPRIPKPYHPDSLIAALQAL